MVLGEFGCAAEKFLGNWKAFFDDSFSLIGARKVSDIVSDNVSDNVSARSNRMNHPSNPRGRGAKTRLRLMLNLTKK